ncbi:hypothetical protein FB451DRAFT_1233069, partial [Mycena latifolia]
MTQHRSFALFCVMGAVLCCQSRIEGILESFKIYDFCLHIPHSVEPRIRYLARSFPCLSSVRVGDPPTTSLLVQMLSPIVVV